VKPDLIALYCSVNNVETDTIKLLKEAGGVKNWSSGSQTYQGCWDTSSWDYVNLYFLIAELILAISQLCKAVELRCRFLLAPFVLQCHTVAVLMDGGPCPCIRLLFVRGENGYALRVTTPPSTSGRYRI